MKSSNHIFVQSDIQHMYMYFSRAAAIVNAQRLVWNSVKERNSLQSKAVLRSVHVLLTYRRKKLAGSMIAGNRLKLVWWRDRLAFPSTGKLLPNASAQHLALHTHTASAIYIHTQMQIYPTVWVRSHAPNKSNCNLKAMCAVSCLFFALLAAKWMSLLFLNKTIMVFKCFPARMTLGFPFTLPQITTKLDIKIKFKNIL